jgi:hypothetical protein
MLTAFIRASLFGLCIIAIMHSPAAAFKKVNLPGTRTKDYMQSLCSQNNGQYIEGQGQYGCITNCGDPNKTSDACGINCSEQTNKCYGWSPARTVTRNPASILHPSVGGIKSRAK